MILYNEDMVKLGVTKLGNETTFSLYSRHATEVVLRLFEQDANEPFLEKPLNQEGNIWTITLKGLPDCYDYTYRCDGPYAPSEGHLFDKEKDLIDPYGKELNKSKEWGAPKQPLRSRITPKIPFDWEGDARPLHALDELILYEMHVRGFTQDPSSQVKCPGTYLGLMEKIPHLKELGVNAIELLPIHTFEERSEPFNNYWGYSTASFFTPMPPYGSPEDLKALVKRLHFEGIEVILDVVYNHTGEGAPLSGIDHATYYSLEQGHDRNDSGCGNTLNCNHPAVIELILDSLRYFVSEFHVDGFRFDLASILTRGVGGIPLERPSLIEKITKDPLLSVTKLIAEPWDPGGLYQVGKFPSHRFGEWNDRFRDDFRSFFKGEERHEEVKKRLIGSPDLFSTPTKSYNFITIHDGFSLRDLVSYNEKHNEPNGENNRDGTSHNLSWNCGIEGNTEDEEILSLRVRQMKNFLLALFFSKGIPMLLMGDEYGHTKQGNNNTWCQDNPLSYFQWGKLEKNLSFFQWVSSLIEIRKRVFSNQDPHFEWIDCECLAVLIGDTQLLAFNPSPQPLDCPLPPNKWSVAIDTSEGQGVFNETSFTLFQRSAILLIAT